MLVQTLLQQINALPPHEIAWLCEELALHLQKIREDIFSRLSDKFARLFAKLEPHALLELSKNISQIQFSTDTLQVDWRVGMGINLEEELQVNFTLKFNPVSQTPENQESNIELLAYFQKIIEKLSYESLESVERALDNILENMQVPYGLDFGTMPILFLDQETAVFSCRIKGKLLQTL